MNSEQLVKLIEGLEHIRRRPAMYICRLDPELAFAFLSGYSCNLSVTFGLDLKETRFQIEQERGWKRRAMHTYHQMIKSKMSPKEIIDELLVIEIEVLRRLASVGT